MKINCMSPRSLFNIILKVLGLYFISELLGLLPQLFSSLYYIWDGSAVGGAWMFFSTIITMIIYSILIVYLVLHTNWMIDKLELDRGFDEEDLSFTVHRSTVLHIVIMLVGLLIIITALPHFFRSLYVYFTQIKNSFGSVAPDKSYLLLYAIELILGILLMIYRKFLVNYMELERRK